MIKKHILNFLLATTLVINSSVVISLTAAAEENFNTTLVDLGPGENTDADKFKYYNSWTSKGSITNVTEDGNTFLRLDGSDSVSDTDPSCFAQIKYTVDGIKEGDSYYVEYDIRGPREVNILSQIFNAGDWSSFKKYGTEWEKKKISGTAMDSAITIKSHKTISQDFDFDNLIVYNTTNAKTLTEDENITVAPESCSVIKDRKMTNPGDNVRVLVSDPQAVPNIKVNDGAVDVKRISNTEYSFVMPDENVTISRAEEKKTFELESSVPKNGEVNVSPLLTEVTLNFETEVKNPEALLAANSEIFESFTAADKTIVLKLKKTELSKKYTVKIPADLVSTSGKNATETTVEFTITDKMPVLEFVDSSIKDGVSDVDVYTGSITVKANNDIDKNTVNKENITITPALDYNVSYDNKIITITFGKLSENTDYEVNISENVKCSDQRITGTVAKKITFRTGGPEKPKVISSVPQNRSKDISTDINNMVINFNADIDITSVDKNSVKVVPDTGYNVSANGKKITLDFTNRLASGTEYKVIVDGISSTLSDEKIYEKIYFTTIEGDYDNPPREITVLKGEPKYNLLDINNGFDGFKGKVIEDKNPEIGKKIEVVPSAKNNLCNYWTDMHKDNAKFMSFMYRFGDENSEKPLKVMSKIILFKLWNDTKPVGSVETELTGDGKWHVAVWDLRDVDFGKVGQVHHTVVSQGDLEAKGLTFELANYRIYRNNPLLNNIEGLETPVAGESVKCSLPKGPYEMLEMNWYEKGSDTPLLETDKFEQNKNYTLKLKLKANENYSFIETGWDNKLANEIRVSVDNNMFKNILTFEADFDTFYSLGTATFGEENMSKPGKFSSGIIDLVFEGLLDKDTVNENTISFKKDGKTIIPEKIEVKDNRIKVQLKSEDIAYGGEYSILLTKDIKSTKGISYSGDMTFSFGSLTLDDVVELYKNMENTPEAAKQFMDNPYSDLIEHSDLYSVLKESGKNTDVLNAVYNDVANIKNKDKADNGKTLSQTMLDRINDIIVYNTALISSDDETVKFLIMSNSLGLCKDDTIDIFNEVLEDKNKTEFINIIKQYDFKDCEKKAEAVKKITGEKLVGFALENAQGWEQVQDILKNGKNVFKNSAEIESLMTKISKSGNEGVVYPKLQGYSGNIDSVADILKNAYNEATRKTDNGRGGGGRGSSGPSATITGGINSNFDVTEKQEAKITEIFNDIENYQWAQKAVENLYDKGIIKGRDNGNFCPQDKVLREEFVKMAVMLLDIYDNDATVDFEDITQDHWSYKYVASAVQNKIINGIGDNRFGTGEGILRQDVCVMLYNILKDKNLKLSEKEPFNDSGNIADYAKEAVEFAMKAGIVNGDENKNFNPKDTLSRAEAAVILDKVSELLN